MSETTIEIRDLTRRELIFADVRGRERATVLKTLSSMMVEQGVAAAADRLYEALWEREELQSTGIGDGVAIPHCKVRGLKQVVMAVATCSEEVDFDAPDGKPVRLIFLLLSPRRDAVSHLRSLSTLSGWLRGHPDLASQLAGRPEEQIYRALSQDDAAATSADNQDA